MHNLYPLKLPYLMAMNTIDRTESLSSGTGAFDFIYDGLIDAQGLAYVGESGSLFSLIGGYTYRITANVYFSVVETTKNVHLQIISGGTLLNAASDMKNQRVSSGIMPITADTFYTPPANTNVTIKTSITVGDSGATNYTFYGDAGSNHPVSNIIIHAISRNGWTA